MREGKLNKRVNISSLLSHEQKIHKGKNSEIYTKIEKHLPRSLYQSYRADSLISTSTQ